jgi:hypothetical protein
MVEHTSDVYLYNNVGDGRPPKERISDLEAKVESILDILGRINKAMDITHKFMDNQCKINDEVEKHHEILEDYQDLISNISESVDLISNFIPRIKPECIND